MTMARKLVVNGIYRHFKNKLYQVKGIAVHSETKEKLVVYQALYGTYSLYVRPLSMFMSEVDHNKYPEVAQKWRFERVSPQADGSLVSLEAETDYTAEPATALDDADYFFDDKAVEAAASEAANVADEKPKISEATVGEEKPDENLMDFLDLNTGKERIEFLTLRGGKLTNEVIDAMAASLDMEIPDGDPETRVAKLKKNIETRSRYEDVERLR